MRADLGRGDDQREGLQGPSAAAAEALAQRIAHLVALAVSVRDAVAHARAHRDSGASRAFRVALDHSDPRAVCKSLGLTFARR